MKIKHSKFNLSHENKLTCGMGTLVPFMCMETVPGDRFRCQSDMILRMMPLIAPMMHKVDVFMHYFFVPTRIIWKNFDTFLTGGKDGNQTVAHPFISQSHSQVTTANMNEGSLADYLGFPNLETIDWETTPVDALPFRAYSAVYNEWYRDENLIDEIGCSDGDGEDTTTNLTLQRRAWHKDLFTNALPWAQRGENVTLPFKGQADVTSDDKGTAAVFPLGPGNHDSTSIATGMFKLTGLAGDGTSHDTNDYRVAGSANPPVAAKTNLIVDLTKVGGGISIQDLRWAVIVEKWLERNARGGIRYIEFLLSHFGVHASDTRLQRPEYLGGGKVPIVIGEVLQTSSTDTTSPQGNMAGKGVSAGSLPGFSKYFEEFGYVVGILSIMPKANYFQGMPRQFSRFSRFEMFFPEFCALGEQAILNKELLAESSDPNGVFGYTPRFQELRQIPSTVHGEFKTSLKFWHLAREFSDTPVLSKEFIECHPSERVFAVEDSSDKFVLDIWNNIQAVRPLPKFANPGVLL